MRAMWKEVHTTQWAKKSPKISLSRTESDEWISITDTCTIATATQSEHQYDLNNNWIKEQFDRTDKRII